MTNDRALGLLSLARKARKIELGEAPVEALCRQGRARLVLLACDAGDAAKRKAARLVEGTRQPLLATPYDKAALGGAMGWSPVAMAAFTDVHLALSFVKALDPDRNAALIEQLSQQAARFQKRAGTKKHR